MFFVLVVVLFVSFVCVLWVLLCDVDCVCVWFEYDVSFVCFVKWLCLWLLLLFVLLLVMIVVLGFGLLKLFFNDVGWLFDVIGKFGMVGGVVMVVFGCGGGVWFVRVFGLWCVFMVGVSCVGVVVLLWFV